MNESLLGVATQNINIISVTKMFIFCTTILQECPDSVSNIFFRDHLVTSLHAKVLSVSKNKSKAYKILRTIPHQCLT